MTMPASIQNCPGKNRIRVSSSANVQEPLAKKMRWNSVKNCCQPSAASVPRPRMMHQRDDGAGEQAAANPARAAAAQVDDGGDADQDQQCSGAEGREDHELDVGHVADFAVLEQLVTAAVDQFAQVARPDQLLR